MLSIFFAASVLTTDPILHFLLSLEHCDCVMDDPLVQ